MPECALERSAPRWEGRDNAQKVMASRLDDSGFGHCLRVESLAWRLTSAHGLDAEACARAGLLHDYARAMSDSDLLSDAQRLGIAVSAEEHDYPYLLHAIVGARLAAEAGLIDNAAEIAAIEGHTLGRSDMSEMDLTIFLADHLEEGRPDIYIGELRELALTDMVAAAKLCHAELLRTVLTRGKKLHPSGVATWNALVEREQHQNEL